MVKSIFWSETQVKTLHCSRWPDLKVSAVVMGPWCCWRRKYHVFSTLRLTPFPIGCEKIVCSFYPSLRVCHMFNVKCQISLLLTEEFLAEWKLTASDAYASVWQCYQCLNWCREVVRIRLVSLLSPWWLIWMWRSGWWQLEVAQRPAVAADSAAGSRKWLKIKMGSFSFQKLSYWMNPPFRLQALVTQTYLIHFFH